jgi:ssDNA-binding Zn-finger/Zn-ribbon topoisomerase 1
LGVNEGNEPIRWESVHKCPKCAFTRNLNKLNLQEVTTGIAFCPRCESSAQVDLQIIPWSEADA